MGYFCFVIVFTMSVIVFCSLLVLGALDEAPANCRASASALPLLSLSPSIGGVGLCFFVTRLVSVHRELSRVDNPLAGCCPGVVFVFNDSIFDVDSKLAHLIGLLPSSSPLP